MLSLFITQFFYILMPFLKLGNITCVLCFAYKIAFLVDVSGSEVLLDTREVALLCAAQQRKPSRHALPPPFPSKFEKKTKKATPRTTMSHLKRKRHFQKDFNHIFRCFIVRFSGGSGMSACSKCRLQCTWTARRFQSTFFYRLEYPVNFFCFYNYDR